MSNIKEDVAKVLIIGDTRVGKSSILTRYCDGTFSEIVTTTVGTDFRVKRVKFDEDKEVKLQIWDTAGQERFRCITKNFYREAHGLMIVFDLNEPDSFKNVEIWLQNLTQELGDEQIVKFLVGNKVDLPRTVLYEDAANLGLKYGIPYYETSAKTGYKVEEVFTTLATDVYQKILKGLKDSILSLDPASKVGRRTLENIPKFKKKGDKDKKDGCC